MKMKVWIFGFMFAVSSLAVSSQTSPTDHFSAVFVASMDQVTIGEPLVDVDDPELNFLTNVLKFRHQDIVHFAEDAIYFYNETFGLDFSTSPPPNDQHELFFEKAKMSPFMLSDEINFFVTSNNWIRTGSTRSTCNRVRYGGFRVLFTGDQTLYGSYGGAEGKPAGFMLVYGIFIIEGCQQSPIIIPYQSSTPVRFEPVDGHLILNLDLYNVILGYGKFEGTGSVVADVHQPEKNRVISHNVFTFPTK